MSTDKDKDVSEVYLDYTAPYKSSLNDYSVIHRQLLDYMTREIEEAVKGLDTRNKREEWRQGMPRLNFFIAGQRGSGKSVFLRHLADNLKKSRKVKLAELCWYDPSESIGLREDFFITVVAAIKTILDKKARYLDSYESENKGYLKACQECMENLDKAIVRLSQERRPLSNLSEHRADKLRLNDPEMNGMIRENFAKCMENMCRLCGVDAFILEIDDIDTRTEQCYNVLECLRLYMGNSYIVTLMAGDKILNIERIRESHFSEFNYRYHESDEQGKETRLKSVVSHASQYFAKLFPVKRQHELQNLYVLSTKYRPIHVYLRKEEKTSGLKLNEVPLKEWLTELFRRAISPKESEVMFYVQYFMSLPLRYVTQILDYWMEIELWESMVLYAYKMRDKASSVWNEASGVDETWEARACEKMNTNESNLSEALKWNIEYHVQMAMTRTLMDLLPLEQYNFESQHTSDGRAYYALLLRLCQNMGDLEHGYYLSDEGNSEDKMLTLLLAVNFRRRIRNLKGFLEYVLYGPASITLYGKALQQFKRENHNPVLKTEQDLKKCFAEYMHVGNWRSASRWARHANMIWCYDRDNYHVHSGVLRISNNDTAELLEWFLKKKITKNGYYKSIALIVSMNRSDDRDNSYYVSIYSFLAYILRCIDICDRVRANNAEDKRGLIAKQKKELKEMTEGYLRIKSCRRPEWQLEVINNKDTYNQSIKLDASGLFSSDHADVLMEDIAKWCNGLSNKYKEAPVDDISPRKMGTIWSNFYYSIRSESHASGNKREEQSASDAIEIFCNVVTKFKKFFKAKKEDKSLADIYCEQIGEFTLMESLEEVLMELKTKAQEAQEKAQEEAQKKEKKS